MLEQIVKLLEKDLGISGIALLLMSIVGYVGYSVAYSGLKTKERFFKIAIFSLPFLFFTLVWTKPFIISNNLFTIAIVSNLFTISVASVIVSFLMGIIWRKWGRSWAFNILYFLKITPEDGYNHTLDEVISVFEPSKSKLVIYTKEGSYTSQLYDHANESIAGGIVDAYGNVRIYVDETSDASFTISEEDKPLTFFPKETILKIDFHINR